MIPSAEVVVERMKMALSEAGYPDAVVAHTGASRRTGYPVFHVPNVSLAVRWLAADIAAQSLGYPCGRPACWSCYVGSRQDQRSCLTGNCAHPEGPARPPRELLRAS